MTYEEARDKIVDGLTRKLKVKSKFYFNDLTQGNFCAAGCSYNHLFEAVFRVALGFGQADFDFDFVTPPLLADGL